MNVSVARRRRLRWAVPGIVVAGVAAATAALTITIAQAAPGLPARTPAQLLAAIAGTTAPPPPLTGTVVETASLGIPQLPEAGSQTSVTSLLAGSHTVKVYYLDPAHFRLSVPVTMGEADVIRNGRALWLWQAGTNSVTHMQLPARAGGQAGPAAPLPAATPLTPQQAARQALAAVGPSTQVRVDSNVLVAGQAAYQLVLVPKERGSLIGRVTIALDGQHPSVPLRVQVFARGAAHPAFQVSYTSVSFVKPTSANFSFSPPPGASVHTVTPPTTPNAGTGSSAASQAAGGAQIIGSHWLSVAVLPASALSGLTGSGGASSAAAQAAQSASGGGPAGHSVNENAAVLGALLKSATKVGGSWGTGRLLHTSLVSVLITSNGHVLIGAVTPTVLFNAAAQVK